MRRTISILTLLVVVASIVAFGSDRRVASAVAPTLTVDYGITGPEALSTWVGAALVAAPMVPSDVETVILVGFRSDHAALDARATAVSDPSSPSYGAYRTVASNAASYNATDEQVGTVVDWFADRGVTVAPDATRTFVRATVTVAILEEFTDSTYGAFAPADDTSGVVLVSPTTAVTSVAPELASAVDRVSGSVFFWYPTDTSASPSRDLPRPAVAPKQPTGASTPIAADGGTPWRTGSPTDACSDAVAMSEGGLPAGLSPAQLRAAYGIDRLWDSGFRGRGARIAVVDYADYRHSDLDGWRSCFGLEGTAITDHVLGPLDADPFQQLETTLDLQSVVSFAPDAERIDWFGVPITTTTTTQMLIELLAPAFDASLTGGVAPDVVTVSFAVCEPQITAYDPSGPVAVSLYDQMVATGVASGIGTFVATGDQGSTGCFPMTYDVATSFPGTSRWVTAVGGTNLTLDAQNHVVSSGTWNDTRMVTPAPPVDTWLNSGGGGLSTLTVRQPRQPDIGQGTARSVPDVSMFADLMPGAFLLFEGAWQPVGGTSLASPLLATAFALQSSARAASGAPRLGHVAPLLYSLASSADPAASSAIVDVVLGDDDAHGVGVYDATPGYDLATGIGWVRQDALFAYLNPPAPDPRPIDPVVPVFTG